MTALSRRTAAAWMLLTAVLVPAVASAATIDPEPLYGRISALEGDLAIRGTDEDEWSYVAVNGIVADADAVLTEEGVLAELEMPGQVFLRLGESTGLDVISLTEGRYHLWTGSAYVTVLEHGDRAVVIETPACAVVPGDRAPVRIDVDEDGATRVRTFAGHADVLGAGDSLLKLAPWSDLRVSADGLFVALGSLGVPPDDPLARWHTARDEYLARLVRPDDAPAYAVGVWDLSDRGTWVVEDHVRYWRPHVEASWRPYHEGSWHHTRLVGWYWVPRLSFEYATCHYGTWRHSNRHGWLWLPSWHWRPSRVSWVVLDDGVCWAPLDRYSRPVLHRRAGHYRYGPYASWSFSSYFDLRHRRSRHTIVKHKTVIKGGVIKVNGRRVVSSIDHLSRARPDRRRRGHRTPSDERLRRIRSVTAHKPAASKHAWRHPRLIARLSQPRHRNAYAGVRVADAGRSPRRAPDRVSPSSRVTVHRGTDTREREDSRSRSRSERSERTRTRSRSETPRKEAVRDPARPLRTRSEAETSTRNSNETVTDARPNSRRTRRETDKEERRSRSATRAERRAEKAEKKKSRTPSKPKPAKVERRSERKTRTADPYARSGRSAAKRSSVTRAATRSSRAAAKGSRDRSRQHRTSGDRTAADKEAGSSRRRDRR